LLTTACLKSTQTVTWFHSIVDHSNK